jgi:hypothetical protein
MHCNHWSQLHTILISKHIIVIPYNMCVHIGARRYFRIYTEAYVGAYVCIYIYVCTNIYYYPPPHNMPMCNNPTVGSLLA